MELSGLVANAPAVVMTVGDEVLQKRTQGEKVTVATTPKSTPVPSLLKVTRELLEVETTSAGRYVGPPDEENRRGLVVIGPS